MGTRLAGVKARQRSLILLGILWSAIVVAGFIKNSLSRAGHSGNDDVAGLLMIIGWVGAVATSLPSRAASSSGKRALDGSDLRRVSPRSFELSAKPRWRQPVSAPKAITTNAASRNTQTISAMTPR